MTRWCRWWSRRCGCAAGCTSRRRGSRAPTRSRKLKITMPGPMTIVDTIADSHYGDKVKMAMAFAELLNQEARGAGSAGRGRDPVRRARLQRLHGRREALGDRRAAPRHRRPALQDGGAHLLRLRHQGQYRLEELARVRSGGSTKRFSRAGEEPPGSGVGRVHPLARADQPAEAPGREGRAARA